MRLTTRAEVVTGDLGRSMRLNERVTSLIGERLPVSLQLATAGMIFALLVSIPLGVLAALRRNTWIDYLCTGFTVLGFAVPNFGLALILIYIGQRAIRKRTKEDCVRFLLPHEAKDSVGYKIAYGTPYAR